MDAKKKLKQDPKKYKIKTYQAEDNMWSDTRINNSKQKNISSIKSKYLRSNKKHNKRLI